MGKTKKELEAEVRNLKTELGHKKVTIARLEEMEMKIRKKLEPFFENSSSNYISTEQMVADVYDRGEIAHKDLYNTEQRILETMSLFGISDVGVFIEDTADRTNMVLSKIEPYAVAAYELTGGYIPHNEAYKKLRKEIRSIKKSLRDSSYELYKDFKAKTNKSREKLYDALSGVVELPWTESIEVVADKVLEVLENPWMIGFESVNSINLEGGEMDLKLEPNLEVKTNEFIGVPEIHKSANFKSVAKDPTTGRNITINAKFGLDEIERLGYGFVRFARTIKQMKTND